MTIPTTLRRRRDQVSSLSRVLDDRRDDERDVTTRQVIGRKLDGQLIYRSVLGECPERGPADTLQVGDLTEFPSAFLAERVTGVPGSSIGAGFGVGALLELDPHDLPRGATTEVTATGRGFNRGLAVDFLLPESSTVHPDVSVTSIEVDSDTEATLTVVVGTAAKLIDEAPVSWGSSAADPVDGATALPSRLANAYGIGLAPVVARYVALFESGSQVVAVGLSAAGEWGDLVGSLAWSAWEPSLTAPVYDDTSGALGNDSVITTRADGSALGVLDFRGGVATSIAANSGRKIAGGVWNRVARRVDYAEWTPGSGLTTDCHLYRVTPDGVTVQHLVDAYAVSRDAGPYDWNRSVTVGGRSGGLAFELGYGAPSSDRVRFVYLDASDVANFQGNGFGTLPPAVGGLDAQAIGWADSLGGSVAGPRRWDGAQGAEGGASWESWVPGTWSTAQGVGGPSANGADGLLFDGTTLVEGSLISPPATPSVTVPITAHPTYGTPRLIFRAAGTT